MTEIYANIVLLDSIKYVERKWKIHNDLKFIAILLGMQLSYTKYCWFLCKWDSRDRNIEAERPIRNFNPSQNNIVAKLLMESKDVLF